MIGALVTVIGIGGLCSAVMLIPGFRTLVLVGGSKLLKWIVRNPGWAVAVLALLWGVYERSDAVEAHASAAQWKAAHTKLSELRAIDQRSITELRAMIARQNGAVLIMAIAARVRQQAAQDALQEAKAYTAEAEGLANRITSEHGSDGSCRTAPAVMAARPKL